MFLCVINGFVHVHFFIFEFCFLVNQLGVGLLVHLEVYEMVQITDYYSVPVHPPPLFGGTSGTDSGHKDEY